MNEPLEPLVAVLWTASHERGIVIMHAVDGLIDGWGMIGVCGGGNGCVESVFVDYAPVWSETRSAIQRMTNVCTNNSPIVDLWKQMSLRVRYSHLWLLSIDKC